MLERMVTIQSRSFGKRKHSFFGALEAYIPSLVIFVFGSRTGWDVGW